MPKSTSFVSPFTNPLKKVSFSLFAVLCALSVLAGTAFAQKFTSLASFDHTNGSAPIAGFVQGIDGNLYGTVYEGGLGAQGQGGAGTVVKLTPSGSLTAIYNFCAKTGCADGIVPNAALVLASEGTLYGTTTGGGNSNNSGAGTAFKVSYSGSLTTLHGFTTWSQAATPQEMVQGADGNFYGVAFQGGANDEGAIFKLTPGGAFSTVYSFCAQSNCRDGRNPQWIALGQDGNLYGVTVDGGANGIGGTVFKLTAKGVLTTLHSFCSKLNCTDGSQPASLVQAADGNFYGIASVGGSHKSNGTVFKLTPSGTFSTLYNFCAMTGCTDGASPLGALIQATDGNLYGTTLVGGVNNMGEIFKLSLSGVQTRLYSFCSEVNCNDGSNPQGGVFQATDGNFYGMTSGGGVSDFGAVFKLSTGLKPFVQTVPISGAVGKKIILLGSNLTGTTAVSFNGVAASFKVISGTEITATVPSGATSGKVKVTTPRGVLLSSVAFQVMR